ncbi:MAG TPA: hypothetical protein VNQ90_16225 [Chthoniobacteraceae bacterium]|nr:hypothetical protein [Chthoniobacteraceae bacterium]
MKRALFLLSSLSLLGFPSANILAANEDGPNFSFYDPTRPGRSFVESMIVPRGRPGDSRRVTAYTVLRYPGKANDPRPEIIVAFNGVLQSDNVELRWGPSTGERWVKVVVTLPARDLKYGVDGPQNPLEVTAKLANGGKITETVQVTGVDFPVLDEARIVGGFLPVSKFNYTLAYRVPPNAIQFGKNFPLVGKYGLKAQMTGKLNFYPIARKYTSETTGGATITVAGKDYGIDVGSKEETQWDGGIWKVDQGEKTWEPGKWVKTESKIYLGWYTSIPLWEKSLLTVLPQEGQKMVDKIPIVGPKLKLMMADLKFDLTANPSLYGEVGLGLTQKEPMVKSLALGGEMDLRLAFNAVIEITGLGKFGMIAMAGGKLNLDMYYPIENNLVGLQNLSAEAYVGTDFYFLCFESSWRFALLQYHFPDLPQGALPPGQRPAQSVPSAPSAGFTLVPPPEPGELIAYPLAPAPNAMPRADAASIASQKAMFRRLGTERALTRRSLMSMAPGGGRRNHPGGSASIEAGAVLPLAVNSTSVAWPGMASSVGNGEMLALFGIDTRAPGTPSGSSQFTQVLWSYFRNGEWTTPVALPAGNGAAQIAPSTAAISNTKPGFIAAWQQLQDPKFQGTGLTEWLDQTQVAVGVLKSDKAHAMPEWKTEILGDPDRADLSPKVTGNLGKEYEDALVTWISTSLAGSTPQPQGGLPADAEFRYALYHDGKWIRPNHADEASRKKQTLKAPKGLLSWDISGHGYQTYLVYSEDMGNGRSRIMAHSHKTDALNMDLNEWSAPVEISTAAGKNIEPQVATAGDGNVVILWIENGDIVVRRAGVGLGLDSARKVLRASTNGTPPSGVKMTLLHDPAGSFDRDIAVSWSEQTPAGPSIVTTVYEYQTGSWSKPAAITPGDDLETLYTTTTDSMGNLVLLYVHTDIAYGTVEAPDEQGKMVAIPNSPIPGREKIMVGRFRPVRDLAFAPDGLTSPNAEFIGGTTVRLNARITSNGMLGYAPQRVSVSFYHGDPKNGGKLIATTNRLMQKAIPGGETVEVGVDWKLEEDIWDHENVPEAVYAVIEPPLGYTEWNPDNNTAVLHLAEIMPSVTVSADRASRDGAAEVNVSIHNSGHPYMKSFPVQVYDYSGARLIKSEMITGVVGGSTTSMNIELPAGSVRGENGADFLVKVDPGNTLKLHPDRRVADRKLHVSSAP